MFDHYIAIDWAKATMAIARMTHDSDRIYSVDCKSDIKEVKTYLSRLKGKRILTFEESTPAKWLYLELKPHVEEVLVCDPHRNRLLLEGPKTDPIDAGKMAQLLRAGLLKPVFHTTDALSELRILVSGYDDLVKEIVRLKNQREAFFMLRGKTSQDTFEEGDVSRMIVDGKDRALELLEEERERHLKEFSKMKRQYPAIRHLESIPGIGIINSVKIMAAIIDIRRFVDKGHFLSYCGLVRLEKLSGGRSYGFRIPRHHRGLKCAFKTAALANLKMKGRLKEYHDYLIREKLYAPHNARHALCRKIATIAYGVLKEGKPFNEERLPCSKTF